MLVPLGLFALTCFFARGPITAQPAAAACADTVNVRTAKSYTMPGSSPITFVEPCTLTAVPGRRFLIEVLRPGASNPLTSAEIAFGGVVYFGVDDVDNGDVLISRVVTPSGVGDLKVTLKGSAGARVVVRITHVNESLYSLYGSSFMGAAAAKTYTKYFAYDGTPPAPHLMTLTNGNADATGSARTKDVEVSLNGQAVLLQSELTLGRAFMTRDVLLSSENVLQVNLIPQQSGKKVSIRFSATDSVTSELAVTAPSDSLVTSASKVLARVQIANSKADTRLYVNGVEKTLSAGTWSDSLSLAAQDGVNRFVFAANRVACSPVLTVFRDTHAPTVEILSPSAALMSTPTTQSTMTFVIKVSDLTRTRVFVDGDPVGFVPLGADSTTFTVPVTLDLGSNKIHFRAIDQMNDTTQFSQFIERVAANEPAPVSATVAAPEMPSTVASTFWEQVRFLWTGAQSIQSGADTTKLSVERLAVIRGQVFARDIGALPNVQVSVLGHLEYGVTKTRADGAFDIAVNGGSPLTLRYTKEGFLESQRVVDVSVLDYAQAVDVAMLGESTRQYAVDTASPQKVVGRFETDANGDRRLTMLFEQGTHCTLTGSGQPVVLTQFHVRAKEYTVGSGGDEAMPGTLPPSSAYTYCVNLSLVEGDALFSGGLPPTMQFDKPVVTYVREFLGVPVGSIVPSGAYDFATGAWIASEDGVVVRIIARGLGVGNLDTDGDHAADAASRYDALGVTAAEAEQIAAEYSIGDSLWRVRLDHFSAHDFNFNRAAVEAAQAQSPAGILHLGTLITDPGMTCACVIENENRVLGETIPIVGTPFSLHYRSSRQPGDVAMRWLHIPLLGASPPADLRRVHVTVDVAGRRFWRTFTPAQAATPWDCKDWDGTDAYGRKVTGSITATVRRGYEFLEKMRLSGDRSSSGQWASPSFPGTGNTTPSGDRAVGRIFWSTQKVAIGVPSMAAAGLGGWTISPHHIYDPSGMGMKYRGDGSMQRGTGQFPVLKHLAGNGHLVGYYPRPSDGSSALSGAVSPTDMAATPDGSIYFTDAGAHVVGRISPSGRYFRVAGTGSPASSFSQNGDSARDVPLSTPNGLVIAPDGTIYFADDDLDRVFKIVRDTLWLVAGNPAVPTYSEDSLAVRVPLLEPSKLALSPDGSLYVSSVGALNRAVIRRVSTDGHIRTYAGGGVNGISDGDGSATGLGIDRPGDLGCDSDGNLYFTEYGRDRVRRVAVDGHLSTYLYSERLRPTALAFNVDGSLYLSQSYHVTSESGGIISALRREVDGSLSIAAGGLPPQGKFGSQDFVSARAALFHDIQALAFNARGELLIGEQASGGSSNGISLVFAEFPTQTAGEIAFPAEDAHSVDIFTPMGRHKRTVDAVTGDTLYLFGYDLAGRLTSITDFNDDVTVIERVGGLPTRIVAPRGQVTVLGVDGGFLHTVTNPANETITLGYEGGGLLTSYANARDATWAYNYSAADGRLDYEAAPAQSGVGQDPKHRRFDQTQVGATRTVTQTSPEGRVTTYSITQMLDGLRQRLVGRPDASQQYSDTRFRAATPFGQQDSTAHSTGEVAVSRPSRDSRYGWWAPVDSFQAVKLPVSGQRRIVTRTRTWGASEFEDKTWVNGKQFTSTFNLTQRLLTATTPLSRKTTATFDAAGRPLLVQMPGLADVVLDYDSFGRLWHLTQSTRVWTYGYDDLGQLLSVTNQANDITHYEHDLAGRIKAIDLPGARRVQFGYDAAGNMDSLRTPKGPVHTFTYSPANLNQEYVPPVVADVASPMTAYVYDSDQLLTSVARPDSGIVDLTYESSTNTGRVSQIDFPNSDRRTTRERTKFTYKPASGSGAGLLATAEREGNAKTVYGYDGSLLTSEQWSGRVQGAVSRTFDGFFRPATETVSAGSIGRTVTYGYDDDGLLTSAASSSAPWTYLIHRATASGVVDSTQGGMVTSSAGYNPFGELQNIRYAVGGQELFQQSIFHNDRGQVERIGERWQGGSGSETVYGYDTAGRLNSVTVDGVLQRQYAYDANGNRVAETSPAPGGGTQLLAGGIYDDQDRLQRYGREVYPAPNGMSWASTGDSAAYSYTANGELAGKSVNLGVPTTYTYDALGSLQGVRLAATGNGQGDTLSYAIDGQNRRIGVRRNGTLERGWLYDGIAVMAELSDSVTLRHRYVYGTRDHVPDLLWDADSAIVYRLITDQLGSVRAVVRVSDGAVIQRTDYDAWGVITAESNGTFQSLGYAGGLTDRTTGLVRFGARDYDPSVGRWTCKDPAGFRGGLNAFAYVRNQPVSHRDPAGLGAATASRRYTCRQTVEFLKWARLDAARGGDDAFRNHAVPGYLDFTQLEPGASFELPDGQVLAADRFGNFIAGYAGYYQGGAFGGELVIAGGWWFDLFSDLTAGRRFNDDADSQPDIYAGFEWAAFESSGGGNCGCH